MSELVLVHHGIKGQEWGKRNGPPYPLDQNDLSAAERKADTGEIKRASNEREARVNSKTMTNEELRKSAERLELESRYMRAVQSQRGKTFIENVASRANTVANLMNSTNTILQFTTGKNFAQLISKKDDSALFKEKVEALELENRYFNALARKNERKKDPGKYVDWDKLADEFAAEFSK